MIKWIMSLFTTRVASKDYEPEGELIEPIRFKDVNNDNRTERGEEESNALYKKFVTVEREKQFWIANNTNDKIIQANILESKDNELIGYLMLNRWLDEEIQYRVVTSSEFSSHTLRSILARKVGLSLGVQEILAKDPKPEVRRMLARWQRPVNHTIANILIKDNDVEVRKSIARNMGEKIRVENMICFSGHIYKFQEFLAKDKSSEVRMELTLNQNLMPKSQIILAEECYKRGEWDNLISLAKNESLCKETKEKIIELLNGQNNFNTRLVLKTLLENRSFAK